MNCDEFEERIQQLLDRRRNLAADARLRRHARRCEDCRAIRRAYLQLFEGLSRSESPALDQGFSERVVHLVQPVTRPASMETWRSRRFLAAWSAVALVLLVALTGIPLLSGGDSEVSEVAAPGSSEPEITESAGSGFRNLAENPHVELHLPWPAQDPEWLLFWERFSDRMAGETAEPLEVFTEGLRPLATSLASVWSGFRDTWPWGRDPGAPVPPPDSGSDGRFPAA